MTKTRGGGGGAGLHGLGNVGTWQMSHHRQHDSDLFIVFPGGKQAGTSQREMPGCMKLRGDWPD
jgi:hypothetical protein